MAASATPRAGSATAARSGASPRTPPPSAPAGRIRPGWWLSRCCVPSPPRTPTPTWCCPSRIRHHGLDKRDAGFATELSYGALRGQGTYDAVLARCVDRPLDQLDPAILDALRIGAHQLLAMRVPAHAALDQTVGLARAVIGAGPSALINAVLRKVTAHTLEEWLELLVAGETRRNQDRLHPLRPPRVDRPRHAPVPGGARPPRHGNQRTPGGRQRRPRGQPRGPAGAGQPGRGPGRRGNAGRTRGRIGALQRRRPRPARLRARRQHPGPGRRLAAGGPRHGGRGPGGAEWRRTRQPTASRANAGWTSAPDPAARPRCSAPSPGSRAPPCWPTSPHRTVPSWSRQALAAVPHETWQVRTGDGRDVGTEMAASLRPRARGRPLQRPRRPAAPAGVPLAPYAQGPRGPWPAAARHSSSRPWMQSDPAAWWPT